MERCKVSWFSTALGRGAIERGGNRISIDASVVDASFLQPGDEVEVEFEPNTDLVRCITFVAAAPWSPPEETSSLLRELLDDQFDRAPEPLLQHLLDRSDSWDAIEDWLSTVGPSLRFWELDKLTGLVSQMPARGLADRLQHQLTHHHERVVTWAIQSLARLDDGDEQQLAEVLKRSCSLEVHRAALDTLTRWARSRRLTRAAVETVIAQLSSTDHGILETAIECLGCSGDPGDTVHLEEFLRNSEGRVSSLAAAAISQLGGELAVKVLLRAVREQWHRGDRQLMTDLDRALVRLTGQDMAWSPDDGTASDEETTLGRDRLERWVRWASSPADFAASDEPLVIVPLDDVCWTVWVQRGEGQLRITPKRPVPWRQNEGLGWLETVSVGSNELLSFVSDEEGGGAVKLVAAPPPTFEGMDASTADPGSTEWREQWLRKLAPGKYLVAHLVIRPEPLHLKQEEQSDEWSALDRSGIGWAFSGMSPGLEVLSLTSGAKEPTMVLIPCSQTPSPIPVALALFDPDEQPLSLVAAVLSGTVQTGRSELLLCCPCEHPGTTKLLYHAITVFARPI